MTAKAKFKPVLSPRWALVSSALPNLNMKHYKSVMILSNFRNFKFPCENLSPLFKTFWRRFWFLTPYLFTRQFSCIQCLPVWTSKKHAKSEQVKALEGFLYRFQGISRLGSAFSFLRCFKLAHIGIQVTSLNRCNKQGIDHRFLSLAYFTWGVKLRESWT